MSTATSGTLSDRANLALECLHQHHLLSTDQVRELVYPDGTARSSQRLLATLATRNLVQSARRRAGRRESRRVWYLTPTGVEVVQSVPGIRPARRAPITEQVAEGQLQHHTLAVNDVGLAFTRAARKRGEDCGPLAWEHEVTHRAGTRKTDVVISDAVLRYESEAADGGVIIDYRFLELDRATVPVERLAAKVAHYVRLATYTPAGQRRPEWQERYLALPGLLIILAHKTPAQLRRRERTLIGMCHTAPGIGRDPALPVWICLLDELIERGPFAPIFTSIDAPDERCDWLGERSDR